MRQRKFQSAYKSICVSSGFIEVPVCALILPPISPRISCCFLLHLLALLLFRQKKMVQTMKPKSANRLTALFEIRLRNLDHGVIILKGNEQTAGSTYIEGRIVLSVTEPIAIKKISLRLFSTLRLKYGDVNKPQQGVRPTRMEKKIYEHNWDGTEFSKYLFDSVDNSSIPNISERSTQPSNKPHNSLLMSKSNSLKGSTSSLKNLGLSFRSLSSTSLANSSHNNSSTNLASKGSHVLVSGNYEIPFSAILPGDMPESVEGLPGASVIYKLEAMIDRGKFHNHMITKKHIRVVRTMTADSVELSETVAVDNTWPSKVEYSLSVPSKAIAIGSGTPVSIMLVPLLKGLRLGDIKMTLVEMYSYIGYIPPPFLAERVVCEKEIPKPSDDDPRYQIDKWEFTYFLQIPLSLSKCTQDLEVQPHMKVRHKLKFVIGLINPDGHVSELRASLPVQLFISPFVTITGSAEDFDGEVISIDDPSEPHAEEVLFHSESHNASLPDLNGGENAETHESIRSNPHSVSSFTGLIAPPVYEQHVYDRLWSDISPMESPLTSGAATPRFFHNRPNGDVLPFAMSSIDTAQLDENLRQLSMQRQQQESYEVSRNISNRNALEPETDSLRNLDHFTRPRPTISPSMSVMQMNALTSPRNASPIHLSRSGSDYNVDSVTTKIPTYSEALKGSVEDTLSPAYLPPLPGSHIDLTEVNRRFEENISKSAPENVLNNKNRLLLARGTSSFSLKGSSNNLSANSSPSSSRNVSFSNLLALSGDSSRQATKRVSRGTGSATFSIPPL